MRVWRRGIKLEGGGEREPVPFAVVTVAVIMCSGDSGTSIPRRPLGYSRPVVDREARSGMLLVGDIAYTAEQRGSCTSEERGDGLEVDIGIWRDV